MMTTTMVMMTEVVNTTMEGSYVLDMIRQQLKEVDGSRVMTIQFIDRNTIHGTRVRTYQTFGYIIPFLVQLYVVHCRPSRPPGLQKKSQRQCEISTHIRV